jgi:hypothetical protein
MPLAWAILDMLQIRLVACDSDFILHVNYHYLYRGDHELRERESTHLLKAAYQSYTPA